ncbi:MAG: ribonuclease Y [bacterium]|nr:ribonuclease Y [bacterium]
MFTTILAVAAALGLGFLGASLLLKKGQSSAPSVEKPSEKVVPSISVPDQQASEDAKTRAREIVVEAKDESLRIRKEAEDEARRVKAEVLEIEKRLETRQDSLTKKLDELGQKEENLSSQQRGVSRKLEDLEKLRQEEVQKLETVASMTKDEAKKIILEKVEGGLKDDIARRIKQAEEEAEAASDERSRDILVSALQRSATNYVAEFTTSRVALPDEEIKGRIIGREGRNIRALEQATGVDFDLDETPGEVRLSCFDPVRREVAKLTLERLLVDGRIQPARIEEFVAAAAKDIDKEIHQAGEQLAYDAGVPHLPKEITDLLGRFKFRTSYGQNLITHTLEVTNLAKAMASELGADVELTKKAALLHDLGKVVSAEVEGPHAQLTRQILEKNHFDEKLINAAAAHHEEEEFKSTEAVLVHLADALSGARPGARFEDYEAFIKRMKDLEDVAYDFPGVDRAYAISAGREVRVVVNPKELDDASTIKLSHDIAEKIQKEQTYPGTVKVTVIRETRAIDTAK